MKLQLLLLTLALSMATGMISAQNWNQFGQDINGVAVDDHCGVSVSMSNDGLTIAVGSFTNDDNGTNTGHVRVFTNEGTSMNSDWVIKGNPIYGLTTDQNFGISVSLSGDGNRVAICSSYNTLSPGEEHIYVFEWNGTDWEQLGNTLNWSSYTIFDGSVAISGNGEVVAVGDLGNNSGGYHAGQVRLYTLNGDEWQQRGSSITGTLEDSSTGNALAISEDGNTVATNMSIGMIVFEWNGTDYEPKGDLLVPFNPMTNADLSGDGNWVAVTGPNAEGESDIKGATQVYHWNGDSWLPEGGIIQGVPQSQLGFDLSLSDDANVLALSSPQIGSAPGEVRVYVREGSNWVQSGNTITADAAIESIGYAIDLNAAGNILAVGFPNYIIGNYGLNDRTRVYRNDDVVGISPHQTSSIEIYPNPTGGPLAIELENTYHPVTVEQYNVFGQLVSVKQYTGAQRIEYNVEGPSGIYLLNVLTTREKSHVLKVIKE